MQIEYWFALRCSMRALGRGLAPKLRACARIGAGGARGKFTHKRAYFPVWPLQRIISLAKHFLHGEDTRYKIQ